MSQLRSRSVPRPPQRKVLAPVAAPKKKKVVIEVSDTDSDSDVEIEVPVKRGRGRPRKYPVASAAAPQRASTSAGSSGKKRPPLPKKKMKTPMSKILGPRRPPSSEDEAPLELAPDSDSDTDVAEKLAEKATEVEFKLPTIPAIGVLIGKPRSGKSFMLRYILYRYMRMKQHFKFGIVYSPSATYNGDFNMLPKHAVRGAFDPQHFEAYITNLRNLTEAGKAEHGQDWQLPPNFIIFDDCIATLTQNKFWDSWCSCFRHTNTYPFITTQYLNARNAVSTLLREYTSWAMMWPSVQKRSLRAMYDSYGGEFDDEEEFVTELKKCKQEPFQCLIFQDGKDSKELSYCRATAGEVPKGLKIIF